LLAGFILFFGSACKQNKFRDEEAVAKDFSVLEFSVLENYPPDVHSEKRIKLDYYDAMTEGFIIPSADQVKGGYFKFSFKIRNKSKSPARYFYKIYYQNESYKFPESDSVTGKENKLCEENFYGSWDDSTMLFKQTPEIPVDDEEHLVEDQIRIVGNPRDEQMCYENGVNGRWKRNPRVGKYSFLLVVSTESAINSKKIPMSVQNICLPEGDHYLNPYYFFRYGEGKKLDNTVSKAAKDTLHVYANPDLGSGIFIDQSKFPSASGFKGTEQCNTDSMLWGTAAFEQFVHYIDASTNMENIPVIADVLGGEYSRREYNWNRSFYSRDELISTTPKTAARPCETVYSDPVKHQIVLHNPKSEFGKWRKENVGIISRHGLCYGKIRVKAKLTEELNKDNMWNGITNAIWLINQSFAEWNLRRPCKKEGYMATYWGGPKDSRVPRVGYSEIDFEILKTPPYCPDQQFPPVYKNPSPDQYHISKWDVPQPAEISEQDDKLSVSCTNWDMACWEPANFGVGCNSIAYGNQTFEAHRWDHWYRALTEKTPARDDEMFAGNYFYFEIEWKPEEIIWRIGPEPDKMRVVGYMNESITSIPNNQMLLIITQEFHNTQWWPGSPYQQSNIPFPSKDIYGFIYDVTIE